MFDRITAETIRNAPRLKGISPERMAAKLTDAYVQVSVANALLDGDAEAIDAQLIERLKSIARSQEVIALTIDDPEIRRSAAYVAARAYQVASFASPSEDVVFTSSSIPTQVSSMLLFVASDATPDAQEMALGLAITGASIESTLLRALSALGRSEFLVVADIALPAFEIPASTDPHELAAYIGYYRCLEALVRMCTALLATERADWIPGGFRQIQQSLEASYAVSRGDETIDADDTILGPWHLATLLDLAELVLVDSALTGVPAPEPAIEAQWRQALERIARRRPTLWKNHRDAVTAGFLNPGTSAVVTFPTGSGKSTVTELKIVAATLASNSVIVLVPTLSLMEQQAAALRSTLPNGRVVAQRDFDDEIDFDRPDGPATFVLTPESCLALFASDPEAFGQVGLVVFDEAHLLASTGDVPSRRSLDATLCLLLLARAFPAADIFLVSAMISNAEPLRDWLRESTGRDALALDDPWKPTRQARGAVIYRADEISQLNSLLVEAQQSATTDGPPALLQRQMNATPQGFFGLLTTWDSRNTRDYRLLPLLPVPAPLGVTGKVSGSGWRLTGNANRTASSIARAGATSGRKVLVFAQQVAWAVSASNDVNVGSVRRTELKRAESALLERAIEAAGAPEVLYGTFEGEYVLGDSLPHHGLLLREERRLHELLYKRPDGLPVLVATSTLAQGMNLPSEIVVIAGDRRFDATSNRPQRLEAQELLNAAGRAGRAGMKSNGLVVVIPSYPIAYDGARQMGPAWFDLQSVFSQADQCVEVSDAITTLLQSERTDESAAELAYLSRRLAESDDPVEAFDLVHRSFGAFLARRGGDIADLDARLTDLALNLDPNQPRWLRSAVASTGLTAEDLLHIGEGLDGPIPDTTELIVWRDWIFALFAQRPAILQNLLRSGSRALFRGAPAEIGAEWDRLEGNQMVTAIGSLLRDWMRGGNLQELELAGVALGLTRRPTQHCEFARKFVLRVVPDLAYAFALPRLVASRRDIDNDLMLELLREVPAAVELGVDSQAKLDYLRASVRHSRIGAHRQAS